MLECILGSRYLREKSTFLSSPTFASTLCLMPVFQDSPMRTPG